MNEVAFEILEHIGTLNERENHDETWTMEINVVSWNGRPPKIDIREWNKSHDRMTKGYTMTEKQAEIMTMCLHNWFRERGNK